MAYNEPPGILQTLTRTLTNAECKGLNTPLQLLPAPGSGFVILLLKLYAELNYGGSNVFTTGGTLTFGYTGGATANTITNTFYISSTNGASGFNSGFPTVGLSENLPLQISTPGTIGGNAANDNTITIHLIYQIAAI